MNGGGVLLLTLGVSFLLEDNPDCTWPEGILFFSDRWLVCFFLMREQGIHVVCFIGLMYSAREPQISHMLSLDIGPAVSIETTQVHKYVSFQPGRGKQDLFFFCGAKGQKGFCFLFCSRKFVWN